MEGRSLAAMVVNDKKGEGKKKSTHNYMPKMKTKDGRQAALR